MLIILPSALRLRGQGRYSPLPWLFQIRLLPMRAFRVRIKGLLPSRRAPCPRRELPCDLFPFYRRRLSAMSAREWHSDMMRHVSAPSASASLHRRHPSSRERTPHLRRNKGRGRNSCCDLRISALLPQLPLSPYRIPRRCRRLPKEALP